MQCLQANEQMNIAIPLKILMIEDSEDDATLIMDAIKQGGYTLDCKRINTEKDLREQLLIAGWDVIICDYNLSQFTSFDPLEFIVQHPCNIPVIMVSGMIGEEIAVNTIKSGAYDYVMKENLIHLVPAIKNALDVSEAKRINLQAQIELKNTNAELRKLTNHLEIIREEERARISRDLHDDLGGNLAALLIDLSWLKDNYKNKYAEPEEKLGKMIGYTKYSLDSLRRIIDDLRPSIIDNLGLEAAIEWQVNSSMERHDLEIQFDKEVNDEDINELLFVPIYRIIQESLNNIVKHAFASRVNIKFIKKYGNIEISVSDDGKGFNSTNKKGVGLIGMRERILQLNGDMSIHSKVGSGTTLHFSIPVEV